MYNVYQHWDPLKVCVVGRSYPPEFYSWIEKPAVRNLFERIAIETEEDYQNIIKKLESYHPKIDYLTNLSYYPFGHAMCFKNIPGLKLPTRFWSSMSYPKKKE